MDTVTETTPVVDWSLADGQGYPMEHSHIAACRLNLQHYLWKDALKFNIHPSIKISNKSTIADVATGTAAWLLDVAGDFPSAKLNGFDNDLRQVPHKDWLPSNVTVRYWNIFEDLPSDLVGKYDYVHVRLLVLVLDGDSQPFINKLLRMLKPGGYLQWDELDCVNMCVKKVSPEIPAPALEQIREKSWANGRHDWTVRIPDFLKEAGFENVDIQYVGDEPKLVRAFNEQHLLTMNEFASSLMRIGKVDAAQTFYRLIEEGYKESTAGAALCIPRIVCVGQKPS
jgi:SAM-dependent methyltransferase